LLHVSGDFLPRRAVSSPRSGQKALGIRHLPADVPAPGALGKVDLDVLGARLLELTGATDDARPPPPAPCRGPDEDGEVA
jgi:hypothetical protein